MNLKKLINVENFTIHELLFKENENKIIQFLRYVFVGLLSTIVDFAALFTSKQFIDNLTITVGIGLFAGFIVTFIGTRTIVFKTKKKPKTLEVIIIGLITIIGIALTEILMNVFTYNLKIHYLISKFIVVIIVMVYNFIFKKIFYKKYNKT